MMMMIIIILMMIDDTVSYHIQDQLLDQCCDLPLLQLMYLPHVDRDIVFRGGNQAWVVYL